MAALPKVSIRPGSARLKWKSPAKNSQNKSLKGRSQCYLTPNKLF